MDFKTVKDDLEAGVEDVGKFAREVVAKRVAIIGVITILVNLAITYGWITPDVSNDVLKWVGAIIDAVAAIAAIAVVRPALTPVKDPRNDAADKLVPVSDVMATVEKVASQAQTEVAEIRQGNIENAPEVLHEVVDAGQQLVDNVKADVEAVVAPIREAANGTAQQPPAPTV